MVAARTPPMSIQMALSVGVPVKHLETSELKELVALMPTTMSAMPPISRAIKRSLFIMSSKGLLIVLAPQGRAVCRKSQFWFATGNDADEHHDDGDHEQDMNQTAHRRAGYQPEEPKNY